MSRRHGPLLVLQGYIQVMTWLLGIFIAVLASNEQEPLLAHTTDVALLENFQIREPVLSPAPESSGGSCVVTRTLMQHVFANSYGRPFVGSYSPPDCSFNRVTINFTVTVAGRQFDRLGLLFLGDVEVFRTSTAEPTATGIIWTYIKEMHHYLALFRDEQKLIFDLPNIVDETYTGPLHATLTVTFSTALSSLPHADLIMPLSASRAAKNRSSAFIIPGPASVEHSFPAYVQRAVVSLSACGQQAEEFWYTNAPSSATDTFEATSSSLNGYSPFREVQLLIDGQLAGVSWPFPVIFTGGIVPGLWRPVAGIDAFDLRQDEIDISPWLGYLCDGGQHSFEIRVVGLSDDDNGTSRISDGVGGHWVVTGTIFLFLNNDKNNRTSSWLSAPRVHAAAPLTTMNVSALQDANGRNVSLEYRVHVSRSLTVSAHSKYSSTSWTQRINYKSKNILTEYGATQLSEQTTKGNDISLPVRYRHEYIYPISVNTTIRSVEGDGFQIDGSLDRGLKHTVKGPAIAPNGVQGMSASANLEGAILYTRQKGSASFRSVPRISGKSFSFGQTTQDFAFKGLLIPSGQSSAANFAGRTPSNDELIEYFARHVEAVNASVVADKETFVLGPSSHPSRSSTANFHLSAEQGAKIEASSAPRAEDEPGRGSVKALLGRGPGRAGKGYLWT